MARAAQPIDPAQSAAQTARMPLRIACSAGHKLVVANDHAEVPITCPRCGEKVAAAGTPAHESFVLPGAATAAAVVAPPVASNAARPRWPVIHASRAAVTPPRSQPAGGLLAAATIAAALFSAAPGILEIAVAWRSAEPTMGFLPARWALALCWLALLQAAYGLYLWQWNDWASAKVVAVALVVLAGTYAGALAVVLFTDPRGWLAGSGGLEFADKLAGGRAALWCLCLVSLSTSLAYFAARLSMRWQQAELLSRGAR